MQLLAQQLEQVVQIAGEGRGGQLFGGQGGVIGWRNFLRILLRLHQCARADVRLILHFQFEVEGLAIGRGDLALADEMRIFIEAEGGGAAAAVGARDAGTAAAEAGPGLQVDRIEGDGGAVAEQLACHAA